MGHDMGRGRGQKYRKIKGGGAGGVGGLSLPFACLAAGLAWRLPAVRPAPAWPACAGPCRPAMAWLPCQGAGRGLGYRGLAVLAVLGWGFFGGKELLLALGGGKGKKMKGG